MPVASCDILLQWQAVRASSIEIGGYAEGVPQDHPRQA